MKTLAPLLCMVALATLARADDVPMPASVPRAYTQECAACHLAYPPGLLPAPSWQRLMGGLEHHYGSDASLDPATVQQLGDWLQRHAGRGRRVGTTPPPEDRITRSAWFERKHRKIAPAVWQHASVRSAANCAACHAGAERGEFDDERLRIPPGLDGRFLQAWKD